MKQNETNLVPESSNIFICEYCHYKSCKKSQYDRHLHTRKHQNATIWNKMKQKIPEKFECLCGKIYGSRTTLWRHKKICNTKDNTIGEEKTKLTDDSLVKMLINLCKELKDENKELIEVIKNGTHNINNSNNNSNNKTFNLQFFLNETCKNAMNIMDFVDSIKLQLSDLVKVGEIGYVEGISNIITTNLKALDVTQRPVHCTDKKREVLYIKDENKWEKENETKTKIRKAIKHIANKNSKLIPTFREKYPDCGKSISKYSDQFNKIVIEAMGGPGDDDMEKEDKIIANISKNVIIDKDKI
jgi:hypothetical protein